MKADLRQLEQKSELRFEQLERRIDRMAVRLGALVVIVAGLLFAALQRWPSINSGSAAMYLLKLGLVS
jgi:hypothetical protein